MLFIPYVQRLKNIAGNNFSRSTLLFHLFVYLNSDVTAVTAYTITNSASLIATHKKQKKLTCTNYKYAKLMFTMYETVFHTKNPNRFLTKRKHLKVNKVLVGCSSKKRSYKVTENNLW